DQARVATWQLYVRRFGDGWGLIGQELISTVDNLLRLTLNDKKQYSARNLVIRSEDIELKLVEGTVFSIDTRDGITGLVLMGKGEMRFTPAPENEKGQVRIFSRSETLEARFDAAFVRVGKPDSHFDAAELVPQPVDRGALRRATRIFDEESVKSYTVELSDLTSDAWTILPGERDFLAELRTRKYGTLSYVRSANEPEDISLFDRARKLTIAMYPSKEKLASRGRFYNEDDLAAIDVLHYDIDVTSLPDRQWIEGRARLRLKVKAPSVGQLTIRLADELAVRSVVSDLFGRMFSLRVSNQNTVLINLPSVVVQDSEMLLTIAYAGRLAPQQPDRETIGVAQDDELGIRHLQDPNFRGLKAEPSYLYSNRSFWYPQPTVTDYATATIRLTVPNDFGCVATGEPVGSSEIGGATGAPRARKVCVFRAGRPARYLSFIVSKFVPGERSSVEFAAHPEHDPGGATPGPSARTAAPASGVVMARPVGFNDAREAGTRDVPPRTGSAQGVSVPAVALAVESHASMLPNSHEISTRAADLFRFYESVVGEAPYPAFTLALVENLLPGGHSPPYFAQLNQPLPHLSLHWKNDPAAFEDYPEFFMAHEIAHQWWGHGVGWQNYHEQWLSEGFAQYFAALYAREYRGEHVFQGIMHRMRNWAASQSSQGPVYLGYRVGHIRGDGRAFRAVVYNKGAVVLHMLRQLVGDDAFFRGIRRFYHDSRYKKVGTEDFRLAMELETGRNLQRFFERWIYSTGLPEVTFTQRVEAGPAGQQVVLRFEQTGPLVYDVPAAVTLDYGNGMHDEIIVPVTESIVEFPVPLKGTLRSASISKANVSPGRFHTGP
ncbi:MAG: M1 family metallopeptidase, partial [Vicinamibacterales bacterium]